MSSGGCCKQKRNRQIEGQTGVGGGRLKVSRWSSTCDFLSAALFLLLFLNDLRTTLVPSLVVSEPGRLASGKIRKSLEDITKITYRVFVSCSLRTERATGWNVCLEVWITTYRECKLAKGRYNYGKCFEQLYRNHNRLVGDFSLLSESCFKDGGPVWRKGHKLYLSGCWACTQDETKHSLNSPRAEETEKWHADR